MDYSPILSRSKSTSEIPLQDGACNMQKNAVEDFAGTGRVKPQQHPLYD